VGPPVTVVIEATRIERIREALRAAVGLGLRGGRVTVWLGAAEGSDDAMIARAIATLRELGHEVRGGLPDGAVAGRVERWTDPGARHELDDLAVERALDRALALDLSGEVCPFTFVRTKLALEALPIGGRLEVVVDHAPARDNVPRSAAEWGQEVEGVAPDGPGRWRIVLIKRVE
jgi:tRNA 2-thiouridine synthesizing protein A